MQRVGIPGKPCARAVIPLADCDLTKVQGGGNCLFGSLCVARLLSSGKAIPDEQRIQKGGDDLRNSYLKILKREVDATKTIDNIPIRTFVEAGADMSFDDYVENMKQYGESPEQWGGFVEACLIAFWCKTAVCICEFTTDREGIVPTRSGGANLGADSRPWLLLWDAGHYSVISASCVVAQRLLASG